MNLLARRMRARLARRDLHLLATLAAAGGGTVTETAGLTGLPWLTVHLALGRLTRAGMLEHHQGRHRVTPAGTAYTGRLADGLRSSLIGGYDAVIAGIPVRTPRLTGGDGDGTA